MPPSTRLKVYAPHTSQPFTVIARPAGTAPDRTGFLARFKPAPVTNFRGYLADSRPIGPASDLAEMPLPARGSWDVWLLAPGCGVRLPLGVVPPTDRECCLTVDLRMPCLSS